MSQYSQFKFNEEGSRKLKAMTEPVGKSQPRELAAKEDRRRINIMMDRARDWNRDVRVSPPSPGFNKTRFPDRSPAGRKAERKNSAERAVWEARIERVQELGQSVIDGTMTREDHSYLDLKQHGEQLNVETPEGEDIRLQNLERGCVLLQEDRTRVQYGISDELRGVMREWKCMQNCFPCLAGQPLPAPFAALFEHVSDGKKTKSAGGVGIVREGRHSMARDIDNKVLSFLEKSFAKTSPHGIRAGSETREAVEPEEQNIQDAISVPRSPEETREEVASPRGSAGLEELMQGSCSLTASPKLALARRAIARSRTPRSPAERKSVV